MGEPLVDSSPKGVSSCLHRGHSTCENVGFEHSSCACFEDGSFEAGTTFGKEDLAEAIGTALAEVMHIYNDDHEGTDPGEDSDENNESPLSLESDLTDALVDIDAEVVTSSTIPSGSASESSIGKSEGGYILKDGTPMLVSAMKGSRAKRGIITSLSVSWAPDVYDPVITSDSHTIKAHQRSSRKSHYKYKPPKGSTSSSRSSNGGKKDKHSRHSTSSNSRREKKHSHHSNGSIRTDTTDQHFKAYGSSISSTTDTDILQCYKISPWVPAEEATPVPVIKTIEQIKRITSCCKEQPLTKFSLQFVAAKYKGMFSLWNQNQVAS